MVKKVKTNLDLSKTSGSDCIPVVVLKSCEPERSHILVKQIVSDIVQILGRSNWCSLYLRMLGKNILLKFIFLLVF